MTNRQHRPGACRTGTTPSPAAALMLCIALGLPAGCAAPRPAAGDLAALEPMPREGPRPAGPLRSGRVQGAPGVPLAAEAVVAAVRADAARLLGIAGLDELTVAIDAVTWGDGSLGCAQPGMMYTQARVPGWLLRVSIGAQRWRYHASRSGAWVLCPEGLGGQPAPGDLTR